MTKKKCIYCGTKTKKYKSLKVLNSFAICGVELIRLGCKKYKMIYCCLICFRDEFNNISELENWYYEPDVDDYWWC